MKKRRKMPETVEQYEDRLIEMIEKRRGEFDVFLTPQVSTCAQCWMMLNRVHRDLMEAQTLVDTVIGSKDQQKDEVNPLLPYYLKLQAELRLQFAALALNFNATPSKVTESTTKGMSDDDPMVEIYKGKR